MYGVCVACMLHSVGDIRNMWFVCAASVYCVCCMCILRVYVDYGVYV
jgi:hypothetical protein